MRTAAEEKNNRSQASTGTRPPQAHTQEALLETLEKDVSFLFVGEDKTRMQEAALRLAQRLNCSLRDKGFTDEDLPCRCQDCCMIRNREHPDVVWIEPKGGSASIRIEDIRRLKERVFLKPFQAEKKVFIIKDAERLGPEAANALLKTLEEPPRDTVLILIAQSTSQLFPTIVSRCQLIRFAHSASQADDSTRAAEELIAGFFDAAESAVNAALYEHLVRLERSEVEQLLEELVYVFRDMLMLRIIGIHGNTLLSGCSVSVLNGWAALFSSEAIEYLLDETLRAKDYIRKNTNIKLTVDILVKAIQKHRKNEAV